MRAFQIAALVETAVRDERERGIIRSKALEDAARQALEALERYNGCLTHFHEPIEYNNAITALRAALAEHYCDTHCTWADHAPGCALAEPVQEPVAKVIATAPKRIWLDLGFDPANEDITFDQLFEATWSQDNATGWGIEYVRADLAAPPLRPAEPVQEPIGWDASAPLVVHPHPAFQTALPQRKPLTDEEIRDLWSWAMTAEAERTATTQQHAFARAIERAHGIGGSDE